VIDMAVPAPKSGRGTKYARKYVKATQDEMRHEVVPKAADFCARKRALLGWGGTEYRRCLKEAIKRLIRGEALE
jgi:hypothetical protein